ncbi:MAG: sensor histidine kinase, partial [Rhodospirillales bacterium]
MRSRTNASSRPKASGTVVSIQVTEEPAIAIIDKGPGIDPASKDEIFDRFWSTDRRCGGAGLGLSIVKRTVDVHGGAIEVRNVKGGGAEFKITLKPLKP